MADLPEPPLWLQEQMDKLHAGPQSSSKAGVCEATRGDDILEGSRNGTLTKFGGYMRRGGLPVDVIRVGLLKMNEAHCRPPLDKEEVEKIAFGLRRYEPDQATSAVIREDFGSFNPQPDKVEEIAPKGLGAIVQEFPRLREPVIHGLLRLGETMNVIAPPKQGKSWLVLSLALSVASGRPWLGKQTERGRVLILDNELHAESIAFRIPKVAEALGIAWDEVKEHVDIISLRGRMMDLRALGRFFKTVNRGQYRLVILDAFYRFLPCNTDENDNGTMASLYT